MKTLDFRSVLLMIVSVCSIAISIVVLLKVKSALRRIAELTESTQTEIRGKMQKEFEQHRQELSEQMNQWFENAIKANKNLMEQHEAKFRNIALDMTDRITTHSKEQIDRYCLEALAKLDAYVNEEQEKLTQWIEQIRTFEGDSAITIEMAETAMNQYPSSRVLFDLLIDQLKPLTQSNDWQIRKNALERMNRSIRVFLDNCSFDEWHYAQMLMKENIKAGNAFIRNLEEQRRNQLAANVATLETRLRQIKNKKTLSPEEIKTLQEADEAVDKRWLDKDEELKARYDLAAQEIVSLLQTQQELDEKTSISYNQKAVQAIREAHKLFQSSEGEYKQGRNLEKLSALLGGWESNRLHTSAQVYYQSVYSEIFSKLDPDAKPRLTELILKEQKKKVS